MEKNNLKEKKKAILSNIIAGIKMHDAGIKPRKHNPEPVCESFSETTRYPNLYLNIKEVPSLAGYEVGDKIIIVSEAEIVSHSKNENFSDSKESFELKLKRIGCKPKD